MFWSSSSVQVFVFEVKVERTHVIKACTVTSGEMVDVVLCERDLMHPVCVKVSHQTLKILMPGESGVLDRLTLCL